MLSDVKATIQVLMLHAEEATTKEAHLEASMDEVRDQLSTSHADIADEIQEVKALIRFGLFYMGATLWLPNF